MLTILKPFALMTLAAIPPTLPKPWMTTQQVSRFPSRAGERVSGQRETAVVGAADAAGTEWKCAVYRKVQEEMKADRGLRIGRMVELGGVSHAGFYRFDPDRRPPPGGDMAEDHG